MNEKHSVIAGFDPKPARKYPIPIITIELAITKRKTPTVQISQDICIAIFLPKLSAMKGIMKKPIKEPMNTIDCKTVDVESHNMYGSNSNTILLG
jgi:hypothetical protein